MKLFSFLTALTLAFSAHAATAPKCANKDADKANIADLLAVINPWGQWEGSADGKSVTIQLSKSSGGKYMGVAEYNGLKVGPYQIKVCDYGDSYSLTILGYEVEFEVISSKKIRVLKQVGSSPSVVLTKTSNKILNPIIP